MSERDRREYLGGHDVAAILGLHPYKSPFAVWLAKTGPPEPEQGESYWVGYPSESAYWGAKSEQAVAEAYTQLTGREVTQAAHVQNPERPHLAGTPDFLVNNEDGWQIGILECKTVGDWAYANWEDGLPAHYRCQALYYLGLTREAWCDVAIRIGGNRLEVVRLVADEHRADIDMLIEYADRWWHVHVVGNSAPPVDGSDATRDALQRRWGTAQVVERVDLSEEWRPLLAERHRTQALIKDLESQRDELDCQLIAAMNGATDAYLPGDEKPSWTWRAGSRQTDRTKAIRDAFAAELPLPEGVTPEEVKTAVRVLDAYRQTVEYRRLDCKAPRAKKGTTT